MNASAEARGKHSLNLVVEQIAATGMELGDWFDKLNTSKTLPGGEPVLSIQELKRGIKGLKFKALSIKDQSALLRYCDPDAAGDITLGELRAAVASIDLPSEIDEFEANAGGTIIKLEACMSAGKTRMCDLFREIDKDGSGTVVFTELRMALEMLTGYAEIANVPPVSPRAKIAEAQATDAAVNPPEAVVAPPAAAE